MRNNEQSLIIADSSGLISLIHTQDSNHRHALTSISRYERWHGSIVVPVDILVETINIIGKKLGHALAVATGHRLRSSSSFLVVETGMVLDRAFALFEGQPASVSLTDCIVMACADHFETKEIFGFDEVFRRNGYHLPATAAIEKAA